MRIILCYVWLSFPIYVDIILNAITLIIRYCIDVANSSGIRPSPQPSCSIPLTSIFFAFATLRLIRFSLPPVIISPLNWLRGGLRYRRHQRCRHRLCHVQGSTARELRSLTTKDSLWLSDNANKLMLIHTL